MPWGVAHNTGSLAPSTGRIPRCTGVDVQVNYVLEVTYGGNERYSLDVP